MHCLFVFLKKARTGISLFFVPIIQEMTDLFLRYQVFNRGLCIIAPFKLQLFFNKRSIFDPRPKNCLSFSKKLPQKIV